MDQALNSTSTEEIRGGNLKDNTVIEAAIDQQPDKLLPRNSVVHQGVMIVAVNVMAVNMPNAWQKSFWWIELNAVPSFIQERVAEIPTCSDLASGDDFQQLIVGVADPLNRFLRIGADLQFRDKTDFRRILTAPLMCP